MVSEIVSLLGAIFAPFLALTKEREDVLPQVSIFLAKRPRIKPLEVFIISLQMLTIYDETTFPYFCSSFS
jgi:hypothetical protein